MTLEEAIAWCYERLATIQFADPKEGNAKRVTIINRHPIVDEILGEGNSIIEAVQDAISNGNTNRPTKRGIFISDFLADMTRKSEKKQ